jgi:hypothetical protein
MKDVKKEGRKEEEATELTPSCPLPNHPIQQTSYK